MLNVSYSITGSKLVDISPVLTGLRGHLQDATTNWELKAKAADWQLTMDRMFPYEKLTEALRAAKPVAEQQQTELAVAPLSKKTKLRARQAALKLKQEQEHRQAEIQVVDPLVEPEEVEPISFAEAARRLGKGVKLVRRRFMKMPGVIKIPGVPRKGKRKYYNWAIPVPLFETVKKSWKVK